MRRFERLSSTLGGGGLAVHSYVGRRLGVGFMGQCFIVAAVPILAVLVGGVIDGSLFLPGRNIGLFEHPGIWAFFGIQIALPISVHYSLKELLRARVRLRAVGALDKQTSIDLTHPLLGHLNLASGSSKLLASFLYTFGLVAFVWNTYQNQLPSIVVPYDFWDSKNYPFGFGITRIYKFYLFVWFLPYIALLHVAILMVALRLIRSARLSGKLKLLPFHPDGVGGLGFVPELVTRPLIVAVLIGTVPMAAAFYVHRAADITPLMGLGILLLTAGIAYFVPILALRVDLMATKRAMVEKLRWLQQASFSEVFEKRKLDFEKLKAGNEGIEGLEKLCAAIKNISNYPHLKRLIGVATLTFTPFVITLLGKLYDDFGPVIQSWIEKP